MSITAVQQNIEGGDFIHHTGPHNSQTADYQEAR